MRHRDVIRITLLVTFLALLIGAHCDLRRLPRTDDNASGVAGLIELARARHETKFVDN